MTNEEKKLLIKRINERISEFRRLGLHDSVTLDHYEEIIALNNIQTTSSGNISTSESNLNNIDDNTINKLLNLNTVGQEKKYAKKQGARNTKEVFEYINNKGQLERWARDNLNYLYADSKSGMQSASDLENAFSEKGGLRRYDYGIIFDLIEKYEKEVAEREKLLRESQYSEGIFD